MIRSSSTERQQVIKWLQKLHCNIPIFVFETNVLVFATFAYGLVKAHEHLGCVTAEEVDGIVKGVMSMADKLDPNDVGRKVPNTIAEIEDYLGNRLPMDTDVPIRLHRIGAELCNLRAEAKKQGYSKFLRQPIITIKWILLRKFVRHLSEDVLTYHSTDKGFIQRFLWWNIRKIHWFLSYFHYSVCPSELTFDGALEILVAGNPRMANVPIDLYREIFGNEKIPIGLPGQAIRRFADMEAHLPRMDIDQRPMPSIPGFREDAVELVKCSYYRGKLLRSPGHPPRHLGIIMDGNRRYSKRRGLDSVLAGHQVGAQKLLQVMSWAFSAGIQNLTVWALSDDNLKRGPQELNPLFSMMADYIREMLMGDAPFLIPEVRFRVIGDRSILPDHLNDIITKAETATANNTRFNFQIALGYGGRSEVTRAAKLAVQAKMEQECLSIDEAVAKVTEADITRQTYSAQLGLPQIDAILRTSGENRLSGFALWESHHAEFAIVQENWPAMKQSTFLKSLLDLSKRNRRFGA
ncbi:hypothetical protein TWF694_001888 [Orbilia ellipsospora]|uniref:Isoprenyl transferase n=1 Tax=Orbilia ellipsospora TaxID=2528407 RepID=A0AAV9X546_9PEZI